MNKVKDIFLKYRAFIWPVVTGLATLIILFFVVYPQFSGYIETRGQIDETENKIKVLEVKAKALNEINIEEIDKDLGVVGSILPTDPQVPEAVVAMQSLVAESGMQLVAISYGSNAGGTSASFQLSVQLEGTQENLKNFMVLLKQSPRLVTFESIAVERGGPTLNVTMPLTIYYQPDLGTAVSETVPTISEDQKQELKLLTDNFAKYNVTTSKTAPDISSVILGKANPFE